MIANPAQTERQHLANQAAPEFSLIRKRCACGKASTARQLAQHGQCVSCLRQVATMQTDAYKDFCRLRDYRKPGAEVPKYTEAEAFALATRKSKACQPAATKAQSNE
ncbi:hypothetical protein [Janthinobacterium violaceinigrum]|uniref:hypothetical protein n=1 Tax=Janthinobacterium violaceinigrum TaxID=2654252 RepID=UPI00186AC846|nr:hypothetical protein [Janthinobacterium violaceinigrum]